MKILDLFKKKKQPERKIRIAVFSDLITDTSGVAIQTRLFVESMLKTGKYQFYCVGANSSVIDIAPLQPEGSEGNLTVLPYPTHGDKDVLQRVIDEFNPDIIWLMTDPRFFSWFPEAIKEVGFKGKTCYYHVWDNLPIPKFLQSFYEAFDSIVCISKLTFNAVHEVLKPSEYSVYTLYIPHAVSSAFCPVSEDEVNETKEAIFGTESKDKFIILFNGKNLFRKNLPSILYAFKLFLDNTNANAVLLAKTDTFTQTGVNTLSLANSLGIPSENFKLIDKDFDIATLNLLYNIADITISASSAEGFGLTTLESMMAGTPIIAPAIGGLTDQLIDNDGNTYGYILPVSTKVISVPEVPYIFDETPSVYSIADALSGAYTAKLEGKLEPMGKAAREYVISAFSLEKNMEYWDKELTRLYQSR